MPPITPEASAGHVAAAIGGLAQLHHQRGAGPLKEGVGEVCPFPRWTISSTRSSQPLDVDLLVDAPEGTSSFGFISCKQFVEQVLGRNIDLHARWIADRGEASPVDVDSGVIKAALARQFDELPVA